MARKRTIYQSEAIFAGPTGDNFRYVTGIYDSGQFDVSQSSAANRQNKTLSTDDFALVSTRGASDVNVSSGYFNQYFSGFSANAFYSGIKTLATQLQRVQSANYSFEINRQDVNQFGNLAAIDRIILEQPTVKLDLDYYLNTGDNESIVGLSLGTDGNGNTAALSGILTSSSSTTPQDIKNYYILTTQEGYDANVVGWQSAGGNIRSLGIGNASLTSYEVNASVGEIPKASISLEGLNMSFINGASGYSPTVNPTDGSLIYNRFNLPTPTSGSSYSALRPGDIQFSISGLGVDLNDLKLQTASIKVDISRDPIQKLGSKFAFAREVKFPVQVTMDVEAIIGDQSAGDYSSIANFINSDPSFTTTLTINRPVSAGSSTTRAIKYTIKKAKVDSQEFSSSIGDNKTLKISLSAQIGGPNDSAAGLFIDV